MLGVVLGVMLMLVLVLVLVAVRQHSCSVRWPQKEKAAPRPERLSSCV
jgi:uncharacterized membrane protein